MELNLSDDVTDYFIRIPEFDLTENERTYLWEYYDRHVDHDVYYIARDGTHDGNIWNGSLNVRNVAFLRERFSRIQVPWKAYYHLQKANTVVEAHQDENRYSIINIPIRNELDVPTLWYKDFPSAETQPLFTTQYGDKSYLINVKRVHEVRNTNPYLRLMFQIHMRQPYEEIRELYYSKKLFV